MYTQPPALVSLYVCSSNHRSIVESVFIDSYTVESYVLFLSQKIILSVNLPQGKLYGLLFVERLWVSLRSFCSFNVNVKQKTMFNCMDMYLKWTRTNLYSHWTFGPHRGKSVRVKNCLNQPYVIIVIIFIFFDTKNSIITESLGNLHPLQLFSNEQNSVLFWSSIQMYFSYSFCLNLISKAYYHRAGC